MAARVGLEPVTSRTKGTEPTAEPPCLPASVVSYFYMDYYYYVSILVVCPISINFTQRIEIRGYGNLCGVTKLGNKLYVLCQSFPSAPNVIRVFEDRHPFRPQKEIELKESKRPFDI